MGIISKFTGKYTANLRKIADEQVARVERRRKQKMELAKTKAEKLKTKAEADREKARIYKELAEAQIAAKNAADSLKKARLEAGDLTTAERIRRAASQAACQTVRAYKKEYKRQSQLATKKRKTTIKRR